MQPIRLAAAALNQTPMDWHTNGRNIRHALDAAREARAVILCLPELCITGYNCEDMFFSSGIQQRAVEMLEELLPHTRDLIACLGLPVFHEGALYNAAALACDGRLLGIVAKQHLAGDGIHYEPRWFRRWPAGEVVMIQVAGQTCPLGDILFDCGGVRIGFEICRDAWVANRTGTRLAQRGADVLLNPSASHFAFAKQQIRERFVLEGSREFCVSYAYANLLGNEAGRAIYDGGTLIASGGKMLARGPRFSYADWLLTTAVVDVDASRRAKMETAVMEKVSGTFSRARLPMENTVAEKVPDTFSEGGTVAADFEYPTVHEPLGSVIFRSGINAKSADANVPGHPAWEKSAHQKHEEFARAVPLALYDYLRKSRANGFVVSISGGADSSTVAVLIHLLVQLGGRELGLPTLVERLEKVSGTFSSDKPERRDKTGTEEKVPDTFSETARQLVNRLLACVYQSTCNSSAQTLEAARAVADAIGAEFVEWNIDKLVEDYVSTVSRAVGRELTWEQDDVSLQNIQARARGPGAWLLANLRGALLLATSNRSEAAVGYATMDGDTCGGLAPIAGIDKAFLLDWLKWMEATGPAGVGPLPGLSAVNKLRPTAELRPPAADQTDEADLMPYRVLDAIERAAIRDKFLPIEVFETVRPQFPQYDARQLAEWVARFFQFWCRNQWKRERYAPSFHLDDENLDPKTWCRFPILNSGFERELSELRDHVQRKHE